MPTTKGKVYLGEQLICHTLTDIETETLAFEQMNASDLPYCSSKAPTSLRPVQPGYCLSFDGVNDHITTSIQTASDTYIEATVKKSATVNTRFIFGCNNTAGTDRIYVDDRTGLFRATVGTSGDTLDFAATTGVWYVLRLYTNGDFYVDGALVGNTGGTMDLAEDIYFGARNNGGSPATYWQGQMSTAFIYSGGVLTQYNLNESTGTVAIDSSGNGNDGTLVNGPTWTTDNSLPYSWLNQVGYSQRMYLDGTDDNIGLGTASNLQLQAADTFEIECDIMFSDSTAVNTIVGWREIGGPSDGWQFRTEATSGVLRLLLFDGAAVTECIGTTDVVDGSKHTVKVTYDGAGTFALFIDGGSETLASSQNNAGSVTYTNSEAIIGSYTTAFSQGIICDLSYTKGGSLVSSYIGNGNTDADWTDQTGINDGTVNGSPSNIYIPRDEATPANDAFGNALQWSGSAFPRRPEYRGSYAGVFDGTDDYVDTGVEVKDDSEFECLIKKTSTTGSVFPFGTTTDTSNRMQVEERTGVWRCIIGTSSQYIDVTETTGEWGTIKLFANGDVYYNGISQGNTGGTQSSNSVVTASRIIFGARSLSGGAGGWWTGNIAQFKTYRAGVLESHYTLSEGVGTTVHDISGNGNDGTITNASTATEGAGFWAGRIDGEANAHNINNGFSLYESGANDLRVPYVSGSAHPSPTVPGGYTLTSQNPAVANSHNDAETTWDVYNIGTGDVPCPESNSNSGLSAIAFDADLTADDSAYMHLSTSVLNDRLIAFSADLTGGDKTLAEKYTE